MTIVTSATGKETGCYRGRGLTGVLPCVFVGDDKGGNLHVEVIFKLRDEG